MGLFLEGAAQEKLSDEVKKVFRSLRSDGFKHSPEALETAGFPSDPLLRFRSSEAEANLAIFNFVHDNGERAQVIIETPDIVEPFQIGPLKAEDQIYMDQQNADRLPYETIRRGPADGGIPRQVPLTQYLQKLQF